MIPVHDKIATGQQQRANSIYAETSFICPSYWQAEAYSDQGRTSYKYQFSVVPALHGSDVVGYINPPGGPIGPDLSQAFKTIWGNFITKDNPSIDSALANGPASNSTATNPASNWPPFAVYAPYQINLNQTCGVAIQFPAAQGVNATSFVEPGLVNDITVHNAYQWEGGRGYRCDFWRAVGSIVPE